MSFWYSTAGTRNRMFLGMVERNWTASSCFAASEIRVLVAIAERRLTWGGK